MEANYVHKDSTTLIQDKLVKNELKNREISIDNLINIIDYLKKEDN